MVIKSSIQVPHLASCGLKTSPTRSHTFITTRQNQQIQRQIPRSNQFTYICSAVPDNNPPVTSINSNIPKGTTDITNERQLLLDALADKSPAQALQSVIQLLEINPENVHFHIAAAKLEQQLGHIEAYKSRLDAALAAAAKPKDTSFILVTMGKLAMQEGETERAEQLLTQASELCIDDPAPLNALASLAQRTGNRNKAKNLYKRVLEMKPDHLRSLQALALAHASEGQHNTARRLFREALKVGPKHAPIWQAYALMEWKRGRYNEAKELFEEGLEKAGEHPPLLQAYAK